MSRVNILVADSQPDTAARLAELLGDIRIPTRVATSADAAIEALNQDVFDAIMVDLALPDGPRMKLLSEIAERWPDVPVVAITETGSVGLAVDAVRAGAADFIRKPYEADEVVYVVRKALATHEAASEQPPPSRLLMPSTQFIGRSSIVNEVLATVRRAADGVATVLIRGESGSGKELVARMVHELSPRRNGAFVKVHCAALPDNLLESELFGYEKGAFTGATTRKPGRVELANGGTLFLDEIGDITPAVQVKLLRVLQDREFERLGGTETCKADVRFVAATHRNLDEMVKTGEFREDLFYRLNVVPVWVPPLRARPEDVDELAVHFCDSVARDNARSVSLEAPAIERLRGQTWPGNVRQLQNFVERLVVLADGPRITAADVDRALEAQSGMLAFAVESGFGPQQTGDSEVIGLEAAVKNAEKRALEKALRKAGGNRNVAARILGISRRSLYYKLQQYEVS